MVPKEERIQFYLSNDDEPVLISGMIFDLDNTLYPASSALADEMHNRMSEFVSRYLKVPMEEATRLRKQGYHRHGTTLRWLQLEQNLDDPEPFLDFVHPHNVQDYLRPDPHLRQLLESIALPKVVLTNAPRSHALRVLEHYEITSCFDAVFDLQKNDYIGKPHAGAYDSCIEHFDVLAQQTIFIDDVPEYLATFRKLGGHCILVDEASRYANHPYSAVRSVHELTRFIK